MSIPFLVKQSIFENELVVNFEEIITILKEKSGQFLKLFYFNRNNIHDILYKENEIIFIDVNQIRKISELFYLDLLIKDNQDIINYEYSKEIIFNLYEELLKIKSDAKKVILAKIIFDLIENYKGFENIDEKVDEKGLNILSNSCIKEMEEKVKKNNKKFLDGIDIDDILSMSLDNIYAEIIVNIFKYDSFSYECALNILNDLEIEYIQITKNIYLKLINFLKSYENDKQKYFIKEIKDFIDIKKINFYYLLLKYVLKNSFFIYQIPFLVNARKLLVSIINNNLYSLFVLISDLEPDIIEKIDFIIKVLVDTNYYYDKYEEIKKSKKFNTIVKDKRIKYIFPLMQIFLDLKIDEINLSENEINILLEKWLLFDNIIKQNKFKKLPLTKLKELFSYLQDKNNELLLLNIYTEEEYKSFQKLNFNYLEENTYNINPLETSVKNNDSIEIDSNSNINIINSNFENIDEFNEQSVKKEYTSTIIEQSYTIQDIKETETEVETEIIKRKSIKYDLNKFRKSDKYEIIEYNKTLEINKLLNDSYYKYAKNISKGHYLISGNKHEIMLYNSFFEKKLEIYLDSKPENIYEINDEDSYNDEIRLIACCRKELVLIKINIKNYSYKRIIKKFENDNINYNINYDSLYDLGNNYLICGIKGGFILDKNNTDLIRNIIFEINYINGINIKEKIFAFTSNDLLPNGKNNLLIFDFSSYKIIKQINNYPFKISNNGLHLMNMEKINSINIDRQILLCSCTSEMQNGKNGFLFIDMNFEKNEFLESFYDTKEFEPHCFCQISLVDNNNSIDGDIAKEENIEIKETEYFLVGGFDNMKRMGCIKLYKIKYDKNNNNMNVKYLIDIITEEVDTFRGFDMDITSITQSKITGNLLITCLDGNVYLFKPINLELFLKN